jgi:HK97 family phage portal protein
MPFQVFASRNRNIDRVKPSAMFQNIAWLLGFPQPLDEPLCFQENPGAVVDHLGDAYAWMPVPPPGMRREIFLLKASMTTPVFESSTGDIWYRTTFENGRTEYLPSVEVFHAMINSTDGISGKSVISYARESLGRQLGARDTQARFYSQGLNPSGIMWVNGLVEKDAREKIRNAYEEAMSGSDNAYRLAILDNKITKFEPITMKPVDAQFLESIQENDVEIADFFGMPLHKLNRGKQAYNSNEQANLEYLNTTLDPYLVQFEQEGNLKWLTREEQTYMYCKFNRDALLRTDAKTRSEVIEKRIQSGVLTPNEGRQIEDLSSFEGGDAHYFPANMGQIQSDGSLKGVNGANQGSENQQK